MSLRQKIILLLLSIFAAYAAVETVVQRLVLLPSFVELEQKAAASNVERVLQALQREVELLVPSSRDWGTWDNTYEYAQDRNEVYAASNLHTQSMESLGVNFLALYYPKGQRLWGLAYDHEAGAEIPLGEFSADSLSQSNPLLDAPGSEESVVSGIYRTDSGSFLVASAPILTSEGKGPTLGRVIMGRRLDDAAIERLGQQARVQLSIKQLEPGAARATGAINHAGVVRYTPITLDEGQEVTHGYTTVLDITGTPILRIEVDTPRAIVAQGRTTLQHATLSLGIAGAVVLLLLMTVLRRTVIEPVSQLTRYAVNVGTHDDLRTRLTLDRKDELGVLAREFNSMVERLAETRQRLLDQSYKSGIAEMASGVLHNIGNAITPVGVKLTNMKRDLQQAPLAEIDMASAELADPATPAERRADLTQFVVSAAYEFAAMVKQMMQEIDTVRVQVDHVQMILSDQPALQPGRTGHRSSGPAPPDGRDVAPPAR